MYHGDYNSDTTRQNFSLGVEELCTVHCLELITFQDGDVLVSSVRHLYHWHPNTSVC